MRHLLVINPNTGQATTQRLSSHLQTLLPSDVVLDCINARFGAPYIACEASHAVASHALLDAWAHHLHSADHAPDGVVIACFGDPGLFALREASAAPVTGLAEASFIQASRLGPFAIVTGGVRWKPMLERLALGLGFASQLQHIELVLETGAQLLADRELALRVLAQACHKAAQTGVKSVILGGAGLAGYAADLQASVDLPLIDSVSAGVDLYLQRALPPSQRSFNGFDTTWTQMPPKMDFRLIDR